MRIYRNNKQFKYWNSMDKSTLLIEKTLGDELAETNSKLEAALAFILKQNHKVISNMLVEATKDIIQFDVLYTT